MPTLLDLPTGRVANFRFLTQQNPDSANPISYIFLCPSIVFVAQFIMNSNPSFILSKPNACLASQITQNMSMLMMILTWVHWKKVFPSVKCSCIVYGLSPDCLWRHQLYSQCWKFGETLINWSTNWLNAQSCRTGHSTHGLDVHR